MTGVWMWPESMKRRKTEAVFDDCRRMGVTDVFFLTKGLAGTTAFPSPHPMTEGRDLLGEALGAAHKRGIRLHAWFTSASDERYKNENPASGLCHYRDGRNRGIVSVRDGGYIAYMQSLISSTLREYPVDGVHFDYIRYNHLAFGWSEEDRKRYAAAGIDLEHIDGLMRKTFYGDPPDKESIFRAFREGDSHAVRLSEVRRGDVFHFAKALTEAARGGRSDLTVSMALMPEGAYDDRAFSDLHYGQNYADLAGLADLFLPMAYSKAYGKGGDWMEEVAGGTLRYGVPTLVGVQAYEGGCAESLRRDIEAAGRVGGIAGVCLFREGAFAAAYRDPDGLTLTNPTASPLASCVIEGDGVEARFDGPVGPGEEIAVKTDFEPLSARAYVGEGKEIPLLFVGS